MKSQKSTVVRGALALVAAGAALGLSACSAGQISQTADQVTAVNGVSAQKDYLGVRDVAVVIAKDGSADLKFTATNEENNAKTVKLQSVKVDGQTVSVSADSTIKPGCNLVVDSPETIAETQKGAKANKCINSGTAPITDAKDVFAGGHKPVVLTFDAAEFKLDAPVVAYTPKAGELHRDPAGIPSDK